MKDIMAMRREGKFGIKSWFVSKVPSGAKVVYRDLELVKYQKGPVVYMMILHIGI